MKQFENLGIKTEILEKLRKRGIKSPTSIQKKVMPSILDKKDVIIKAKTGSGKTLAFLLPILNKNPQGTVLILAPTRELVIQIFEEAEKINVNNFKILPVYGGKSYSHQEETLKGKVDMIIATPGRLMDFYKGGQVKFDSLKFLIVDEADQMLLLGFKKELDEILQILPKKRQTLCVSATFDKEVKKLVYGVTNEALLIEENDNQDNIEKIVIDVNSRSKFDALCTVLNEEKPYMAIIFTKTKLKADKLEEKLSYKFYSTQKIHGDISQVKREKILKSFKNVEFRYLITTNILSRGLDVEGVTHIFNYDVPEEPTEYIHRIGRTGRKGNSGKSYIFVSPEEIEHFREIEKALGDKLVYKTIDIIEDLECDHQDEKKYSKKIKTRTFDFEEETLKENKKNSKNKPFRDEKYGKKIGHEKNRKKLKK